MEQGAGGACTKGPVVHAPRGRWCMHQGGGGACTAGVAVHTDFGFYITNVIQTHAPRGRWCMHQGAGGACTKGQVVHAPRGLCCLYQRAALHTPGVLLCMHQLLLLCMIQVLGVPMGAVALRWGKLGSELFGSAA